MNRLVWISGLFAQPQRLWWLIGLLICLAIIWRTMRTREAWRQAIGLGAGSAATRRNRWLMADLGLGCSALILIIVALAGPIDDNAIGTASQSNLQVVCLLDRSRSMWAQDVDGSRLDLSRKLVRSVMARTPGAAFAVVSFAGRARVDVPLTRDFQGLEQRLSRITAIEDELFGSNLADGLRQAEKSFAERMQSNKLLLVFSDGETHQPKDEFSDRIGAPIELPQGTQVIVVCVGDRHRGGRIRLVGTHDEPAQFLTYDGETVYSVADQGVADYRSGAYASARVAFADAAQSQNAKLRYPATFNLAGAIVSSAGQTDAADAQTDIRQAIDLYRQCLPAAYRSADVRVNIEVAFGLLQGHTGEPKNDSSSADNRSPNDSTEDASSGQADEPPSAPGGSGADGAGNQDATEPPDLEQPLQNSAAQQMLLDIRNREQPENRPATGSNSQPTPAVPALTGKPW